MFAGFKGTPPLNQAGHTSTVLLSGSNQGIQQGTPLSQTLNNVVIGSGWSIVDPNCSNNILIGNTDYNFLRQGGNAAPRTTIRLTSTTGGNVTIVGSFQYVDNQAFDITAPCVVIGKYTGSAAPGTNSISIGTNASATGSSAVAIGGTASGNYSVNIGVASTSGSNSVNISGSPSSGANLINIGSAGLNKANSIQLSASAFANSIGDFIGLTTFNTGYWAGTTAGLYGYLVGNNFITLWRQTTDATPVEIGGGADGSNTPTNYITMSDVCSLAFDLTVIARVSPGGTDSAAWKVQFLVNRRTGVATTEIVGTPIITSIGASAGATSGAWGITVTADTTNGRPSIKVVGQAATTIRWTVTGSMTKIAG